MAECRKPATMEKLKHLFQAYKGKIRKLNDNIMKGQDGKLTIVNVPPHDGRTFAAFRCLIFKKLC